MSQNEKPSLTAEQRRIIKKTRGLTVYGQQARFALRMPGDLMEQVVSASEGENINTWINRQLRHLFESGLKQNSDKDRLTLLEEEGEGLIDRVDLWVNEFEIRLRKLGS